MPANEDQVVCLADFKIQISHIHPDETHAIRHDFDREELIVDDYPILLANKIVKFIEPDTHVKIAAARAQWIAEQNARNKVGAKPSSIGDTNASTEVYHNPPLLHSAQSVPINPTTPSKSKLEAMVLDSVQTTRPTTPGSTLLSPLQNEEINTTTPAPSKLVEQYSDRTTTPKARSQSKQMRGVAVRKTPARGRGSRGGRGRPRGQGRSTLQVRATREASDRSTPAPSASQASRTSASVLEPEFPSYNTRSKRSPLLLVCLDHTYRSVDASYAKPTLVLRHRIATEALRDLFQWALFCNEKKRIVNLTEALHVRHHSYARVRELKEAAMLFELASLNITCDRLIQIWEDGNVEYVHCEDVEQKEGETPENDVVSDSAMDTDSEVDQVDPDEDGPLQIISKTFAETPATCLSFVPGQPFNIFDVMLKDSFVNRLLAADMAQTA